MKKLVYCTVVIALIGLTGAHSLEAQGVRGVMDWIMKMSGPGLRGWGVSVWLPVGEAAGEPAGEPPARLRGSIAWRDSGSSDDAVSPAGSQINITTYQATLEFPLRAPVDWLKVGVGVGIARHDFGGDADEFTKMSLPFYAYFGIPITPWLDGVLELGAHYFMPFDFTDFAPLTVDVARDGFGELAPWIVLGLDFVVP
ncbi:MAG: hypothetical protein IH968_07890 [Gemmatimonadetes bacterium]|nr:hypothetical protein [Gemmatimonadota bacterium]